MLDKLRKKWYYKIPSPLVKVFHFFPWQTQKRYRLEKKAVFFYYFFAENCWQMNKNDYNSSIIKKRKGQ
jgi:hypothetical protein